MRSLIKKWFLNVWNYLGFSITRINQPFNLDSILAFYLNKYSTLNFVQIGACDGVSFDPLFSFIYRNSKRVKGVVVEPLPDLYKKLKSNYRKFPHIIAENAAIHNHESEMLLYRVNPKFSKVLPKWTIGIASFDRDHHLLTSIPKEYMITEKVKCLSLNSLIKKHQLHQIGLLQIDTEGYDAEIILNIDFNLIKPDIIHFEHGLKYSTMTHNTFSKVLDFLHKNDYEIALEKGDAIAYQKKIILEPA